MFGAGIMANVWIRPLNPVLMVLSVMVATWSGIIPEYLNDSTDLAEDARCCLAMLVAVFCKANAQQAKARMA